MFEESGMTREILSDETWRTFRSPDGNYREADYEDGEWYAAVSLPTGIAPVDEGPALPPIARHDFANEAIELVEPLRKAIATGSQPGRIRVSLLTADALMLALDRPNREQVMTSRITAATTLQALELTNGNRLNDRLKRAAKKLVGAAKVDPDSWAADVYLHLLGRGPNDEEAKLAREMLGEKVTEEGVADFLWSVVLQPEFDFIQ